MTFRNRRPPHMAISTNDAPDGNVRQTGLKWQDATHRENAANRTPNKWSTHFHKIALTVVRISPQTPGHWMFNCAFLGFTHHRLSTPVTGSPKAAQREAIALVRKRLEQMANELDDEL